MNRRDFLINTTYAFAYCSIPTIISSNNYFRQSQSVPFDPNQLAPLSHTLEKDTFMCMEWLRKAGWERFFSQLLNEPVNLKNPKNLQDWTKPIPENLLMKLRSNLGFDDFGGCRLVEPGFPAFSLLYHGLASPRVRPHGVIAYPSLYILDQIENYIYGLLPWQKYREIYNLSPTQDLFLSVHAYHYRPAAKTPHHRHADFVYSKTGIARIGEEPLHYDPLNRWFTNEPKDPQKKRSVSVTPARYGLFIAKLVTAKDLSLLRSATPKLGDRFSDLTDSQNHFLLPIRKLFNNDLLIKQSALSFTESHISQKLSQLVASKKIITWKQLSPPVLTSRSLIDQSPERTIGSSFLIMSQPRPLVRQAKVNETPVFFFVPKGSEDNRYFNSFNTQLVENIELLQPLKDSSGAYWHNANDYNHPRNQALFLNISHERSSSGYHFHQIKRRKDNSFDLYLQRGGYYSPLFEDSICDGNISVYVSQINTREIGPVSTALLEAFSIVAAPDFFPQVDAFDLIDFDVMPGMSRESSFFEGGITSLANCRIPPDPAVIKADDQRCNTTFTAVFSCPPAGSMTLLPGSATALYGPPKFAAYSYLPDSCSGIFAPGWDITYSKTEDGKYFIGTQGLGSPFVEDMKLCSAMNGMWPAASPDASRTYQGGLETNFRNPTAIPLLDEELGYHKDAPTENNLESFGWDGEQGPFLQWYEGKWYVNFTDLGRADLVQNVLNGRLDMSRLRKLTAQEICKRMNALKNCIKVLPKKNFGRFQSLEQMVGFSRYWLVSAEKVKWGTNAPLAYGIPATLVGKNKQWIKKPEYISFRGEGYLFVLVDCEDDKPEKNWVDEKRRRLQCNSIYVCEIGSSRVVYTEAGHGIIDWKEVKL